MKKSVFIRIAALVLTLVLLAGNVFAATGTVRSNTGARHTLCTELSAQAKAYYTGNYRIEKLCALDGVDAPKDSWLATQNNPLYSALQTLMSETQINTISYQALPNYWRSTDTAPGAGQYLFFYADIDATTIDEDGYPYYKRMNREHIWCKSNASFYELGGGCDLHHLRPSINFVNAAKNYYTFGNVKGVYSDSKATKVGSAEVCWQSDSKEMFEVKDDIKGDVARILLYVYVRWAQPNLYSNVVQSMLPPMDKDDNINNGHRVVENLDTLLSWMELDPVDEWEMARNDQCENAQGNRNVFIDYPELAWLMFGREVPDTMKTPSGIAENGIPTYCASEGYTDVPAEGNWAHTGIDFVIDCGIMGSTQKETLTFEPTTSCSRAMIVSMLYRLAGSPQTVFEGRFSDVPAGQWYSAAVIWAYHNNIVKGYDNGHFGPNDLVTREQLAVILKAYAGFAKKPTDGRASLADFPDEGKVTWSRDAVRWAVDAKLISGKIVNGETILDPQGKATRAEVASILMRFIQNIIDA